MEAKRIQSTQSGDGTHSRDVLAGGRVLPLESREGALGLWAGLGEVSPLTGTC